MKNLQTFDEFLNENLNEGMYQQDLRELHFETDPKKQEALKLKMGAGYGGITAKEKIENADYALRKFRKEIGYGDGKNVDVFIPGTYDAIHSRLGDGPHAKKIVPKKWTKKLYFEWIETAASGGGVNHSFEMAQNAKNEPGLIAWVQKNFVWDETPLQRIQWDIEAYT